MTIHEAADAGNVAVVKTLLKTYPELISSTNQYGYTALHLAARKGHTDVMRLLLVKGANVDSGDTWLLTPLDHAAGIGNIAAVKLLLDNKANVNAGWKVDSGLATPLSWAILNTNRNSKVVMHLLLDRGAKIDNTLLCLAVSVGNEEAVKLLLRRGADVNAKDPSDPSEPTPLHNAAARGNKEIVKLLLKYKANINAKNNLGSTPLQLAIWNEKKDIADLLRAHGAKE
jgi:ankyrin repeat protein